LQKIAKTWAEQGIEPAPFEFVPSNIVVPDVELIDDGRRRRARRVQGYLFNNAESLTFLKQEIYNALALRGGRVTALREVDVRD
jgi:hypothetical protein